MPKFKSTEASLYNGISQQGSELRLPSQVEDAVNANLTLSRGIEKRPPVELLASEVGSFSPESLFFPSPFNDDLSFVFVIAGAGSTISSKVYDTNGISYPIVYTGASQSYLETAKAGGTFSPIQAIQMASVLDYTFVSNKNVVPAMSSDVADIAPDILDDGYIWIKNGTQQVARTLSINGTNVTDAKDTLNDSSRVLDAFVSGAPAGYTVTKTSNAVGRVRKTVTAPFTLTATDTLSDTTMAASLLSGTKIDDLPPIADDETVITIIPEENSDNEYYLKYNASTKSWAETTAPSESFAIDETTMPHAFIKKTDDISGTVTGTPNQVYFSLETIDWNDRTSGGNDTSQLPSFIGTPIADTFFFKNRLGFVSGESVILSATDDLFRFWPTTVKEVIADDPIDVSVSSTSNVTLQHVAAFPDSLIIVGDNAQFNLNSGGKVFSPENVVLDPTTSYSASINVPPLSVGSTLYFVAPQSSFSAIREYSVQPDTLITDAADVTAHVPRLIPNNVKQLISENNLEYMFLINTDAYDSTGNDIFIYKFYWQGNEKIQSAWIKWSFWFKPLGGITFDGKLLLIGTENIAGVPTTVVTTLNLSDAPPTILDDSGVAIKSSRPNIDRITLNNNPLTALGEFFLLEVSEAQYNYIDIDGGVPVVVDREIGIEYTIIGRLTDSGLFYLALSAPSNLSPTNLGSHIEDTVLGSYVIGATPFVDPEGLPTFPLTFPITL
jgi:hypothetical protein